MPVPMIWRNRRRNILLLTGICCLAIIAAVWLTIRSSSGSDVPVKQERLMTGKRHDLLQGQWKFMPGIARDTKSLRIVPPALAIVEQDGSGGQPNPPVNLYGSHLEDATDFKISATVAGTTDTATLQFYGSAPLIADEFRIEAPSLRLSITGDDLEVSIWDGTGQQAATTQTYTITGKRPVDIGFIHRNNALEFRSNGKALGSTDARGIFKKRQVWFGFDGAKPWTLPHFSAEPVGNRQLAIADSSTIRLAPAGDGLQSLAAKKRPGFYIGAAMALGPLATDTEYTAVALEHFGQITPENAMKWQALHPAPDTYTFHYADAITDIAKRHNLTVHGHTLVFGEANPAWVSSLPTVTAEQKERVKQVMLDHIGAVVGHFKGKVASWDVVNEPLADYDNFKAETGDILRNHLWHKAMGEAYIAEAFRKAKAVDPDAKLFINEYGLEEDGERWDAFYALVSRLKKQGVPIDGVGFQSHVYTSGDRISAHTLRNHIRALEQLGLESRISEIDVYAWGGALNQANQYADVLDVCLSEPSCISYTTWGISDRYNTYKDQGKILYGEDFLWDESMNPSLAVTRIRELLTR